MQPRIRLATLALSLLAASTLQPFPALASPAPRVEVNGQPLQAVTLTLDAGATYVPLRAVSESLGAAVRWSPEAQAVEAALGADRVHLYLGLPIASVNGERVALSAPPQLVDGRVYVPLRFIAEAFGSQVTWNEQEQLVRIHMEPGALPPEPAPLPPPGVMLAPVLTESEPLGRQEDRLLRADRPWQEVYLQSRLEEQLRGVEGLAVMPAAALRTAVNAMEPQWLRYLTYLRAPDRSELAPIFPVELAGEALNVTCFVQVSLTTNGKEPITSATETAITCAGPPGDLTEPVRHEAAEPLAPEASLGALAERWGAWAARELSAAALRELRVAANLRAEFAADLVSQGEEQGAAKLLDGAGPYGVLSPDWAVLRAELYDRQGLQAEALELLRRAAALEEVPGEAHAQLIKRYLGARNLAAAMPLLQKVHTAEQTNLSLADLGGFRTSLARAYANAGQNREAAAVLKVLFAGGGGEPGPDATYIACRVYQALGWRHEASLMAELLSAGPGGSGDHEAEASRRDLLLATRP